MDLLILIGLALFLISSIAVLIVCLMAWAIGQDTNRGGFEF